MQHDSFLDNKYWNDLKSKSSIAGITLDEKVTPKDFELYGDRLAQRQIDMFVKSGAKDLNTLSILDIGCGMGRILKPFSRQFAKVTGVDINEKILEAAKIYTENPSNIETVQNDGRTIPFPENSFDLVYSGGVLQHIPDINVIMGYFEEGLRVLKPNGLLNFSFQVWMTSRQGGVNGDRMGAQIRATDIEDILKKTGNKLVNIYHDPKDPFPHYNVVIKKCTPSKGKENIQINSKLSGSIKPEVVTEMSVRTGIFEDLPSYQNLRMHWANGPSKKITFFKQSNTFNNYLFKIKKKLFSI